MDDPNSRVSPNPPSRRWASCQLLDADETTVPIVRLIGNQSMNASICPRTAGSSTMDCKIRGRCKERRVKRPRRNRMIRTS